MDVCPQDTRRGGSGHPDGQRRHPLLHDTLGERTRVVDGRMAVGINRPKRPRADDRVGVSRTAKLSHSLRGELVVCAATAHFNDRKDAPHDRQVREAVPAQT